MFIKFWLKCGNSLNSPISYPENSRPRFGHFEFAKYKTRVLSNSIFQDSILGVGSYRGSENKIIWSCTTNPTVTECVVVWFRFVRPSCFVGWQFVLFCFVMYCWPLPLVPTVTGWFAARVIFIYVSTFCFVSRLLTTTRLCTSPRERLLGVMTAQFHSVYNFA